MNWLAIPFFRNLTATNKLAQQQHFTFCQVSGLEGFEEALARLQSTKNFVCVSDISNGYTELNNTPHTRRVKTVFFAMRHPIDDMAARQTCMDTMRELFRQFMTKLILEKTRIEQQHLYLDPRIQFQEIDRYFFSGWPAHTSKSPSTPTPPSSTTTKSGLNRLKIVITQEDKLT